MNRLTLCSFAAVAALGLIAANWTVAATAPIQPPLTPSPAAAGGELGLSTKRSLTLDGANRVLAAAIAKATERSAGGAIAVVDDGGALIAFQRIDGTFAAGATVSLGKARTSAIFKKPTKAFEDAINGGRIALAAVNEMTPLQGGVPIIVDGQVVGAIGVSGAHSQQEDEEIALAGAAAVGSPASPTAK